MAVKQENGTIPALRDTVSSALVWLAVAPIRFYGRFLSRGLPRRCKYEPTCSAYAISALRSYGLVRGVVLAGWRILRCNPLSNGGYDPLEHQRLFRSRPGDYGLARSSEDGIGRGAAETGA